MFADQLKDEQGAGAPKYKGVLTYEDMLKTIAYLVKLHAGEEGYDPDDIDHFGNRRLRSVGELIQNQIRIGLSRMERVVKERMTTQDVEAITPQTLINIRPVVASIKEFFGTSQLSQFMDQTNTLSGLTHKRRLCALGPGGLSRERAGFEVRDVHPSHYGRMCPIETPGGSEHRPDRVAVELRRASTSSGSSRPRTGASRAARSPPRSTTCRPTRRTGTSSRRRTRRYDPKTGQLGHDRSSCAARAARSTRCRPTEVDYMDVSPKQLVSVGGRADPVPRARRREPGPDGREHAEAGCAAAPLGGAARGHRRGVPRRGRRRRRAGRRGSGVVDDVSADQIVVKERAGKLRVYDLIKFRRSNQGTNINQKPLVNAGDKVTKGQVIADGPSTEAGEIALGKNLVVAYMPWEGHNYEDAIIISERLVKDDVLTSIHIEEHEVDARDTKLGAEEITRDIPNVSEEILKDLDERGIVRIGAEVTPGDYLVGKVTPKGETELTPEERLLRAIFGEKAREVRDTSLKVPHGEQGKVIGVRVFNRDDGDELPPGVNQLVRVYVAQKRKISDGDKLAGRHGNKGVISTILPEEDMPFLADGTPVDIILNPLGVPSRMNLGQVLEAHLGWAALGGFTKDGQDHLRAGPRRTPVFDGAREDEILEAIAVRTRTATA